MKTTYRYHQYIDEYMDMVDNNEVVACKEQHLLMDFLRWKLSEPDVVIDSDIIYKSVEIPAKYFGFELQPWERFINAFIYGVRYTDGRLMFDRYLLLLGRGSGKNGFISFNTFFMLTKHLGISQYDIDLVATAEDQAKRSFEDVYNVIDDPRNSAKLSRCFYKSKVLIQHKGTRSTFQYNTANARTKDSKRTGAVVFDEVHEYTNYDNVTVYVSGLGKKPDPREFYITTDGKQRGGVLDDLKATAAMVLNKELPRSTLFPFICRIDAKEDADNFDMWVKAVPSLPYNPTLQREIEKQYYDMQQNDRLYMEFFRKRMNFPLDDILAEVASYDERLATDQPMPELDYRPDAIGGIDYADKKDFCAVGLLFKHDSKRYFVHHSFVYRDSIRLQGINQEIIDIGVDKGLITLVDGVEIGTDLLIEWFLNKAKKYEITKVACDLFRASILTQKFTDAGFTIQTVRKGVITHSLLAPLVQELFTNNGIIFPDDPVMRWYCGNVYKHVHLNGNIEYKKIEAKKRKTDGFFAFLHALNFDGELTEDGIFTAEDFKVMMF